MNDHGGARANQILEDAGAILHGDHFVYITGDHGDGWIDKDAIYPHTDRVERLCRDLATGLAGWGV
jgi:orotate phosphoribosyltransferase